jgi:hypothetical protein
MLLPRLVPTNVLALPYTSIVTYLLSLRQPARRCGTRSLGSFSRIQTNPVLEFRAQDPWREPQCYGVFGNLGLQM